jgi:predicted ATP-grasp superfamily ATP-dependent carboligase
LKVFVYEHVTGGGLVGEPLPRRLLAEARMMRDALVQDLAVLPGIEVHALRDPRTCACPGARTRDVQSQPERERLFTALARACDAAWIVAPETGGVLERLTRIAADAGTRLLGSTPAAVAVCTSKRQTAARLAAAGVPVVPELAPADVPARAAGHWIVKPDDGCGASQVRTFRRADALHAFLDRHATAGALLVQPFLAGTPASLSVVAHDGRARLLAVNLQHVSERRGRLRLDGLTVGALPDTDGGLHALADRVVRAVPGLQGYFGVDLVLAPRGPVVVEVNPRLTTSWCGLSQLLDGSPAALVLGHRAPEPASGVRPPSVAGVAVDIETGGWRRR